MTASNDIQLNRIPNTPPLLLRAALTRKSPGRSPRFPSVQLTVDGIHVDEAKLRRYSEICGFAPSRQLPMSYLHVLAFRLQMVMMLRRDFPVAPMGCIHLANTLRQYRPVEVGEAITLHCRLGENQLTDKGVEFNFICSAYIGQDKVWEDHSHYLSRMKTGVKKTDKGPHPQPRQFEHCDLWPIRPAQARRYARASGDFNPIHLHNLSAKLLGFKRMVIHGMWSQAACIAALKDEVGERSECGVEFKTPIFLPASVQFCRESNAEGWDFALRSKNGEKPHLNGYLRGLS